MKRLLLSLLVAVGVVGCGPTRDEVVEPAAAQQEGAGFTDGFGLKLKLDPGMWHEAERSSGKIVLEYRVNGCESTTCSKLILALPAPGIEGDYYRLVKDGGFTGGVTCPELFQAADIRVRGDAPVGEVAAEIGGVSAKQYVYAPCEGGGHPRILNWYFSEKHLLVRFEEVLNGAYFEETGLEIAFQEATMLR